MQTELQTNSKRLVRLTHYRRRQRRSQLHRQALLIKVQHPTQMPSLLISQVLAPPEGWSLSLWRVQIFGQEKSPLCNRQLSAVPITYRRLLSQTKLCSPCWSSD